MPRRLLDEHLGTTGDPKSTPSCVRRRQAAREVNTLLSSRMRLTALQVYEIRLRRAKGEGVRALAREYGVTPAAISRICTGRFHREVSGPRTHRTRPDGLAAPSEPSSDVDAS